MRKISGILAASALLASIVFVAPAAHASQSLTGSGSSYMGTFQQVCSGVYTKNRVSYNPSGSGAGRTQFAAGTTDFGGSDSPYSSGAPANFTYVPLVAGAVTLTYNVPGLRELRLTPKVTSDIFTGKITTWDAAPIKKLNPSAKLPKQNIQVVYRSDTSGTVQNFANYMIQTVGGTWKDNGSWGTALGQSPVGVGAAQNQGVVARLAQTQFSIGIADPADTKKAKLPVASLRNALGEFVKPTAAAAGRFIVDQTVEANGLVKFDYKAKVRGGYPATLIAYGLAPTASKNPEKAAAVKDYFTFILRTCGPQRASSSDYVPVTGKLQAAALRLIATIK